MITFYLKMHKWRSQIYASVSFWLKQMIQVAVGFTHLQCFGVRFTMATYIRDLLLKQNVDGPYMADWESIIEIGVIETSC